MKDFSYKMFYSQIDKLYNNRTANKWEVSYMKRHMNRNIKKVMKRNTREKHNNKEKQTKIQKALDKTSN